MPIPAPVKGDVRRELLLSRLTTALEEPQTVAFVSAPAGSGKTRLLAQWARDRRDESAAVVWVSLLRGEADLPRLRSALERLGDSHLRRALARVPRQRSVATARSLARALREAAGRVIIIIDDVHRIESDSAAALLSVFVQSVPTNVHVVLSGRGTRMIPLARRKVSGIALELTGRDLAFAASEVKRFFLERDIQLTQAEISDALERTEGWATGLQVMAANAVRDRETPGVPLRGDAPEMVDYFAEELVADLDGELIDFLEVTSVPEGFTVELASTLFGGSSAAAAIDRLLRLNVLVAMDGATYRYHPLLREYLLGRLRDRGDATVHRLEGAAAEWYAREQDDLPALQHAMRSGRAVCVEGILRRCGMQLILRGHADLVLAATSQIPMVQRAGPGARMLVAAAALARGDASAAAVLPVVSEPDESEADRRWRAGLELHAAVRRGGISEALDRLGLEPDSFTDEPVLDTYAFVQAAMGELYVGRLDRAEEFARFAGDLGRATGTVAAELQAGAVLNTAALFRGRLRDVLESGAVLDQRWRDLGEPDDSFFEVTRVWRYWVPYERMHEADPERTLRAAAQVIDIGAEAAIARGLHGMLALLSADTAPDPRVAAIALRDSLAPREDMPLPVHWYAMMSPFVVRAFNRLGESTIRDRFIDDLSYALGTAGEVQIARAIAAVHDHREGTARDALAAVLDGAAPCLLPASMIDAWLLESVLDVQDGEPDRAQISLAAALALAEPEDHVRRVAEAGPVVSRLLAAKVTAASRTRFAESVRERLATAGVLVDEELTQREVIVLAALSRNATLRQIAQQEFISPNTVKTHVRNIYRKLGVSDREGVTAAAHALGIR